MRCFGLSAGLLVVGLAVTGCSPFREVATRPSQPIDRHGAPVVAVPRDLRGRDRDPCRRLLTNEQLLSLDLPPSSAKSASTVGIPDCTWTAGNERIVTVSVWLGRDLLINTYRVRLFDVFEPTSVGPLPAVVQKSSPDAIACTVSTGVADGQGFETTWTELARASGRSTADPCERAKAVAETVVGNLPPLR